MEKTRLNLFLLPKPKSFLKAILLMKLAFMLTLVTCMQVSASVFSQKKFTLDLEDVKLAKLLKIIEKQSDYRFVYSNDAIAADTKVTVSVTDKTVEQVLAAALNSTGLTYRVMSDKLVGIAPKAEQMADISVKGRVTDPAGTPLVGVSVRVAKTNIGTVTDMKGEYTLTAPSNAVLVFSYVGHIDQEVAVGGRTSLNVTLQVDTKGLNEVVVIAYGTANRKTFTGSLAQIDSKALQTRPISNVFNALEGAAAGIQVNAGSGQPGAGPSIRIRGVGSINASSEPLYVVDGVPFEGNISSLATDDIESMSLLKDASASALYGARAANGVVIITTKKGKRGSHRVNVRGMQGITSRAIPEYERVDAFQYYPLMWESYRNTLFTGSTTLEAANQTATNRITERLGYNPFNVANNDIVRTDGTLNPDAQLRYADDLDWTKAVQRTGTRGDYGVSFNGGSDKSDYFISLGYLKEKGFVMKSDFERINGRINVNSNPLSWFRTGLNVNGTFTKSNQANTVDNSTAYINPFNFTRNMGPIYPIHARDAVTGELVLDRNGNTIYDLGDGSLGGQVARPAGANAGRHIIQETELNDNSFKRNALSARTFGEVKFLRDFKFTTNLGVDVTNDLVGTFDNTTVGDGAPAGRASRTSRTTTGFTFNQLLNYNRTFGLHNIDVLLGHENFDRTYNYFYGARQMVIVDGASTELDNFTTTNTLSSRTDKYRTEGYFTRATYNYDQKYFASASFRRDGTSRFSKDLRWGSFWSVGAAWNLSNESFMKDQSWVDLLKVRSSYGSVGNDALLDEDGNAIYYAWQALYDPYPNAAEPGVLQRTIASNLVWEQNKTFDVGVDFGFFKERVTGSIEYFHRQSSNLLFRVPTPLSSGLTFQNRNIGTMWNKGFEVQVGVDVVRNKDFKWNVNLNATTYKNQITEQPQREIISGTKKLMVGQSQFDYWLREYLGVDPEDGQPLYRAQNTTINPNNRNTRVTKNGDTATILLSNARYHYAGSAIPDVYGGITNTFNYKNFELSFVVSYQIGGKVYDQTYMGLMHGGTYGSALHVDALQRWQKAGDETNVPKMQFNNVNNINAGTSDRWLTSASFVNLRRVSLGYTLPKAWTSAMRINSANIFASGENLYLRTARKGMNVTQAFSGVTSNAYSPARVVTVGINVGL
ncbi:SusC/RagA family TonB-linked outer membrane protein [Chitinophaga rhizophila]|uniref:TonB-dependent receptor n=1 Tax=Chitinophaga rhizophila TaxID=2866212 RepID=A0ABS7GBS5_9BACT|nr:SusC/RagA family TonB-linked outer membrane protein [Chitinophaga rhizophila]MBW8685129.1 TonB-dependent receptor [Chitinophaga rhizophila]